jgi:hypothetical protein
MFLVAAPESGLLTDVEPLLFLLFQSETPVASLHTGFVMMKSLSKGITNGITKVSKTVKQHLLEAIRKTNEDFVICMAMFGNGVVIGMEKIIMKSVRKTT